jgi:hypothetical protein
LGRNHIQRVWNTRLIFDRERLSQARQQPESIRQNNVVEERSKRFVMRRLGISANRAQQGGIRVCLVAYQVLEHADHVSHFIKEPEWHRWFVRQESRRLN